MRYVSSVLIALCAVILAGCATVEENAPVAPPAVSQREAEPVKKFVTFSPDEVVIQGNVVCYRETTTPQGECVNRVEHPQLSHLMFTLDDGKYKLIPGGRWVMYYHDTLNATQPFTLSTLDDKPFGQCTVKLDRKTPTRVYIEECVYQGRSFEVSTKVSPDRKKIISMNATIRHAGTNTVTMFVYKAN